MSDLEYMISKLDSLLKNLGRAERCNGLNDQIFFKLNGKKVYLAMFNCRGVPEFQNLVKEYFYTCALSKDTSGYQYDVTVTKTKKELNSVSLIFDPKDNIYIFKKYHSDLLLQSFQFNSELTNSDIFNLYLNIDYVNELLEILKITINNTSVFQREIDDY